jgi:hypothetical protein
MIVKIVVPDSIYANVYFARGEQGPQGVTGNTGPQGPSGIVNVDSPITNSGTTTAANIGLNQALIQIAPAQVTGTAVVTADSRLSDQRVPTDGSVTDTKIVAGGLSPNRVTGTAVITTDARLSDSRTPTAHAATHASAGSDPVTLAQSQITNLVSDLTAKAPIDSPVFTTKVSLPVTSGTFLGTNSLGEIYKVGSAPGLGYVPYTASVGGGIAWQNLATLVKTDVANAFTVGGHSITNNAAGTIPLYIRAIASQTADLTQWQNSAGTMVARVDKNGSISAPYFGPSGSGLLGYLDWTGNTPTFNTGGASVVGMVLKAAASQSADLLQLQDSAGNTYLRMSTFGGITTNLGSSFPGRLSVGAGSATTIGAVIRGAASQSANLQEWQNSAGTILARMSSAGIFRASQLLSLNGLASMGEFNNGAIFEFVRATGASYNPGANRATLYFRDGTNAGTLKLVVRAGAAGAETTILDNIPQ